MDLTKKNLKNFTRKRYLTKKRGWKRLTRKREKKYRPKEMDLTKKSLKISPGKEISTQKKWKNLTRKRVSKTARQRRMLMKLGFKSIFCFFVNTKKQMMLPDNIYWWYIFYQYLYLLMIYISLVFIFSSVFLAVQNSSIEWYCWSIYRSKPTNNQSLESLKIESDLLN